MDAKDYSVLKRIILLIVNQIAKIWAGCLAIITLHLKADQWDSNAWLLRKESSATLQDRGGPTFSRTNEWAKSWFKISLSFELASESNPAFACPNLNVTELKGVS